MKYPAEFSSEARAAVVAELFRAGRLHNERTRGYPDRHFRQHRSLETFILSVFLVYARKAIELGTKGVWTVDYVQAQALEGLRRITNEITLKRNYPTFVDEYTWHIRREAQRDFEATSEWKQFEDELLVLAESQERAIGIPTFNPAVKMGLGPSGSTGTDAGASVQPVLDAPDKSKLDLKRISKFIEEEGYKNDDLAAVLGISSRAVSSLRNDGVYHGAGALTKLANLMKCDLEDLFYPEASM